MATRNWQDGNANWNTAADWGGTVPGPNDAAVINQGDPTVTAPISVNSITIGPASLDFQNAGATSQVSTNLTNGGTLHLDYFNSQGGSQLNVAGRFTNTNYTQIGNSALSQATTFTTHYLANTGTIELDGSATKQATLNVGYSASFGTGSTLTGTVRLFGDTLISFTTGQISALAAGSYLRLAGTNARIANASDTTTNSALTGLGTINRNAQLLLDNGNSVAITNNLTNYGTLELDYFNSEGGSSLSLGGRLTNLGYIQIGNSALSSAATVTTKYIVNTGTIELDGSATKQATLNVGYSASFGTSSTLTGTVRLFGDTLISFTTGQISALAAGSYLRLAGTNARIADASDTTTNSALTGLGTINRNAQLLLDNGNSVAITNNLTNYGTLELDYFNAEGGSSLSLGGRLTNLGYMQIGNSALSSSDTVTTRYLVNKGTIELDAPNAPAAEAISSSPQATLDVGSVAGFGTNGSLTGTVRLFGNTLIEFTSGQMTSLGDGSYLRLDGTSARIADASDITSNSALTGLTTIGSGAQFFLDNGASVATTSNLNNYGNLNIDYYNGEGGTATSIAGRLINHGYVQIGNGNQGANDSLTVGSLTNTGTINLYGTNSNTTNYQGSLIVNAAAGTGTLGHLSGAVYLQNDTLLQFASGQITTIDSGASLRINGSTAFVADAGSTSSNSALTGLTETDGSLYLENGATVTTSGGLANYGDLRLDNYNGESGSSMTVGGNLDNENYLQLGNTAQTLGEVLTVASLTNNGSITLYGNNNAMPNVAASLIVNSAAGTGNTGELTGSIYLQGDTLLQFASGQINTIDNGASLRINGNNAFVADSGSTSSNSALTGLSENDGALYLENGATVTTSGALTNYGDLRLDNYNAESGASLTVGGNFDNENNLQLGNGSQSLGEVLTAASLTNTGTIGLYGNGATAGASISTSGAVANSGAINLYNDKQTFAGAVSGTGTMTLNNNSTLELDGSVAAGQTVSYNGADTLKLGAAKTFAGSISNFNVGDYLDLTNFAAASPYSFAENAQGTAGTLTVGTGANAAHVTFNGSYTTASFTAASDGASGLLIGHA